MAKMTKKEMSDKLDKYIKLYKSVSDANKRLEQSNRDLQNQLATAKANLENANNAVEINKNLLRQMTEEHSKKEQELIDLMTRLKAKLREMGYDGNLDNLGN